MSAPSPSSSHHRPTSAGSSGTPAQSPYLRRVPVPAGGAVQGVCLSASPSRSSLQPSTSSRSIAGGSNSSGGLSPLGRPGSSGSAVAATGPRSPAGRLPPAPIALPSPVSSQSSQHSLQRVPVPVRYADDSQGGGGEDEFGRPHPSSSSQHPSSRSSSHSQHSSHFQPSSQSPTQPARSSRPPQAGAGPERLPYKPLIQLFPDIPLAAPSPSYPPPPSKRHPEKPVGSAQSKREAYKHHRERNAERELQRVADEEGVTRIGEGADLRDGLLTPPLSQEPTTWSLSAEVDFDDLPQKRIQPARLEKDKIEPFSVSGIPGMKRIWEAGMCELTDEMGQRVKFRDLLGKGPPGRKTAVFFIRHFWCGQCQDYMSASIPELDPAVLKKANVDVVIISNGHWQIIKKYREIFNCPYPIFVDSPRRLYNYLGMTLLNNDFGPLRQAERAKYNVHSVPSQLIHGIGNGLFKMPIRDPGKLTQLGGEFVFGPASVCHFVHRMVNTSDHMEAIEVLERGAGVDPELFYAAHEANNAPAPKPLDDKTRAEVNARLLEASREADRQAARELQWQRDWEAKREAELDQIKRRKLERRAGRLRREAEDAAIAAEDAYWRDVDAQSASASVSTTPSQARVRMAEVERRLYDEAFRPDQRVWTEEEQEAELSRAMMCARVDDEEAQEQQARQRASGSMEEYYAQTGRSQVFDLATDDNDHEATHHSDDDGVGEHHQQPRGGSFRQPRLATAVSTGSGSGSGFHPSFIHDDGDMMEHPASDEDDGDLASDSDYHGGDRASWSSAADRWRFRSRRGTEVSGGSFPTPANPGGRRGSDKTPPKVASGDEDKRYLVPTGEGGSNGDESRRGS